MTETVIKRSRPEPASAHGVFSWIPSERPNPEVDKFEIVEISMGHSLKVQVGDVFRISSIDSDGGQVWSKLEWHGSGNINGPAKVYQFNSLDEDSLEELSKMRIGNQLLVVAFCNMIFSLAFVLLLHLINPDKFDIVGFFGGLALQFIVFLMLISAGFFTGSSSLLKRNKTWFSEPLNTRNCLDE